MCLISAFVSKTLNFMNTSETLLEVDGLIDYNPEDETGMTQWTSRPLSLYFRLHAQSLRCLLYIFFLFPFSTQLTCWFFIEFPSVSSRYWTYPKHFCCTMQNCFLMLLGCCCVWEDRWVQARSSIAVWLYLFFRSTIMFVSCFFFAHPF